MKQPHEPGSRPVDPDSDQAVEVRKRDMPGNPLGPDRPEKPKDATPDDITPAP